MKPVKPGADHFLGPPPFPPPLPPPLLPCENVASTTWSFKSCMTHSPVPLQAPLQPVNFHLLSGLAVSVTVLPVPYGAEQEGLGQEIPVGLLVTLPLPKMDTQRVEVEGGSVRLTGVDGPDVFPA